MAIPTTQRPPMRGRAGFTPPERPAQLAGVTPTEPPQHGPGTRAPRHSAAESGEHFRHTETNPGPAVGRRQRVSGAEVQQAERTLNLAQAFLAHMQIAGVVARRRDQQLLHHRDSTPFSKSKVAKECRKE
jgi:hypothetical protein